MLPRGALWLLLVLAMAHATTATGVEASSQQPSNPTLYKTNAVPTGRTELTFDYSWRFKIGEPPAALPPLTSASADPSFSINLTTALGYSCSSLAWSQLGLFSSGDCRAACSAASNGCLAWQYYTPFEQIP
eukprot:SAG31_NODE_16332_length_713_cov_1.037459_1_plen_130_part_01